MKDKTIVLWGKGNIGKDTYKKYFMNQNVIMVDSSELMLSILIYWEMK